MNMKNIEEIQAALADLFERIKAVDTSGTDILTSYLELERSLLGKYRELLKNRLANGSVDETMRDFTKLMMSGYTDTIACYRDAQKKMFGTQVEFAEGYMSFLDKMMETLRDSKTEASEPDPSAAAEQQPTAKKKSKPSAS